MMNNNYNDGVFYGMYYNSLDEKYVFINNHQ